MIANQHDPNGKRLICAAYLVLLFRAINNDVGKQKSYHDENFFQQI